VVRVVRVFNTMALTGYKVFHFGCAPEYRGRWITAGSEPGFHIWDDQESAERYRERLNGGEILPVQYKGHIRPISEPDGPAWQAEQIFIPDDVGALLAEATDLPVREVADTLQA